jgi:hypothetical protein
MPSQSGPRQVKMEKHMRLAHSALPIVLALAALSLAAESSPRPMKSSMDLGRAVRVAGEINAPVPTVGQLTDTESVSDLASVGQSVS